LKGKHCDISVFNRSIDCVAAFGCTVGKRARHVLNLVAHEMPRLIPMVGQIVSSHDSL